MWMFYQGCVRQSIYFSNYTTQGSPLKWLSSVHNSPLLVSYGHGSPVPRFLIRSSRPHIPILGLVGAGVSLWPGPRPAPAEPIFVPFVLFVVRLFVPIAGLLEARFTRAQVSVGHVGARFAVLSHRMQSEITGSIQRLRWGPCPAGSCSPHACFRCRG